MKIGKRRTLEAIYPLSIEKFAKEIEIRPPFVRRRMIMIANAIQEQADNVLSNMRLSPDQHKLAKTVRDVILKRADIIMNRFRS